MEKRLFLVRILRTSGTVLPTTGNSSWQKVSKKQRLQLACIFYQLVDHLAISLCSLYR